MSKKQKTHQLMEANLASLLEHNNPPSPSIRDAVKGLTTEPLKELGKKDGEIQDVVRSIEELEDQCDGLTKALEEYSPILSPIRQMPAEIIQDIFYYCLPSHRNPVMSNSEAPLLLMCVCKSWRSIALSSPRIWSRLHIPMPFFRVWSTALPQAPSWAYSQPHVVADQREAEERYRRIMSQRRQIVESWLSRSGTCPLSISLSFSSETLFPGDLRSTDDGNDLVQIFTSIFSAQRLEDLEISAPFEVYEALESKISVNDIPILKRLRLSFSSSLFTPHPSPPRKQVVLLQAPALQQVSIVAESVHLLDPTSALLTWTNLTHLSSHYVTESDAVRILRRCRNLEHCTLDIASTSTMEGSRSHLSYVSTHIFMPPPPPLEASLLTSAKQLSMRVHQHVRSDHYQAKIGKGRQVVASQRRAQYRGGSPVYLARSLPEHARDRHPTADWADPGDVGRHRRHHGLDSARAVAVWRP